jgi:hypothetical protein
MKLSIVLATATLFMFTASATSKNVTFEKSNESLETQACYTAAKKGLSATRALVRKNNIDFNHFKHNVLCNGERLTVFAVKHVRSRAGDPSLRKEVVKIVSLSTLDRSIESQLCFDAVMLGEQQAREKHNLRSTKLTCNGKELSTFLKSFRNIKVITDQDMASNTF